MHYVIVISDQVSVSWHTFVYRHVHVHVLNESSIGIIKVHVYVYYIMITKSLGTNKPTATQ